MRKSARHRHFCIRAEHAVRGVWSPLHQRHRMPAILAMLQIPTARFGRRRVRARRLILREFRSNHASPFRAALLAEHFPERNVSLQVVRTLPVRRILFVLVRIARFTHAFRNLCGYQIRKYTHEGLLFPLAFCRRVLIARSRIGVVVCIKRALSGRRIASRIFQRELWCLADWHRVFDILGDNFSSVAGVARVPRTELAGCLYSRAPRPILPRKNQISKLCSDIGSAVVACNPPSFLPRERRAILSLRRICVARETYKDAYLAAANTRFSNILRPAGNRRHKQYCDREENRFRHTHNLPFYR
jgi:hypothetical protein